MTSIGSQHPLPENIPHLTSPGPNTGNIIGNNGIGGNGSAVPHMNGQSGSPVKESSFLHRETSIDDQEVNTQEDNEDESISPPAVKEGVPIRWQH